MLPEIQISETFVLPTYFTYLSLLYCLLITFLPWWARRNQMDVRLTLRLALSIMVSGFLGARLLHVVYENPHFYLNHPERIFFVWLGGFVFFGGALAAGLTCFLILRQKHENIGLWLDFWAPVVALGYGLGRVACLLNGCCYGAFCELPWAIGHRHPTQAYAIAWELLTLVLVLRLRRTDWFLRRAGRVFATYISFHGVGRLVMENFREDDRGPLVLSLSLSTVISLLLIAGSLIWLLQSKPLPTPKLIP